jgi:hypothetical protein
VAIAVACGVARAQDDGPIEVSKREKLKWFGVERTGASLEFITRYRLDQLDTPGSPRRKDTESLYREILNLSADAYLGHPNLVSLDLSGAIGLTQEEFQNDLTDFDQRTNELFTEYNVAATILRQSKYPVMVYSMRNESQLDRRFGGSLDNVVTEHGITLNLRTKYLPSYFRYFHRVQDQTSQTGDTNFNVTQDTFEWQGQWTIGEGNSMTWDYTYDSVDESGMLRRTNSFDRHDVLAIHLWDFGPEDRHRLRSTVSYFQENGTYSFDRLRWDETLRLRHTPKFETRYEYTFNTQDRSGSEQTSHRGLVGLRHELFESLVTTASAGAGQLTISDSDFTSEDWFARMELRYDKIVPYGMLNATTALNFSQRDDSARGSSIRITDELRVFGVGGLIVIDRQNVPAGSIVITDVAGLIIYSDGSDYTVRTFDDRVEIRRVLGGDIADGQAVLIDYEIGPEPASSTTTTGLGLTARYDFEEGTLKGLGLYTRYMQQDQSRDSSGGSPAADIRDLVLGADYDFWRMSLKAEQEFRDSSISPYNATRLEARYAQRLGRGSGVMLSAFYHDIDNTDDDVHITTQAITGRWNQRLTSRLNASLTALWRNDQDNNNLNTTGFEQEVELTWRRGQMEIYGSFRNVMKDSDTDDRVFQRFYLGIKREF